MIKLIVYNEFYGEESKNYMSSFFITHGNVNFALQLIKKISYSYRKDLAEFIVDNYESVNDLNIVLNFYRQKNIVDKIISIVDKHKNQTQFKNFINCVLNNGSLEIEIQNKFKQKFQNK